MAMIRDPKLKFLNVKSDKDDRKQHNTAVIVVAGALSKLGFEINYDHVDTTIPKNRDIPLTAYSKKKRRKADIAFGLYDDTLVHVYIDVFRQGQFLNDKDIHNKNMQQKEK